MAEERPKILVVDDDDAIRKFLRISLSATGYDFLEARSGEQALAQAALRSPQLIILDLGLPDMDGREVVARLRDWYEGPIIVLSVRAAETEKVAALDAGADDYVVKPFGIAELLARIRVMLRHRPADAAAPALDLGALQVDFAAREVTASGRKIVLTKKEFELLALLARHAGKVVTQRQILVDLWGPGHEGDTQYLRVYIGQLRQKLGDDPSRPRFIKTEPGVGYRLIVDKGEL